MSAPRMFNHTNNPDAKKSSAYVIVTNGEFLIREILIEIIQDKIIVALDGAADKLANLKITPHIILGDFDSIAKDNPWGIKQTFDDIDNDAPAYQNAQGIMIVPSKNQDLTDLVKAIQYCDSQAATCIDIVCASGGRMDHHEGNLRCLFSEYKTSRPLYLHTDQQTLCMAKDTKLKIEGRVGDKCGLFAYPEAKFTSEGLMYEGNQYPLKFGVSESIGNSLQATSATIAIKGSALIVMPPIYLSQRAYADMSLVEQLTLRLRDAKQCALPDLDYVPAVFIK